MPTYRVTNRSSGRQVWNGPADDALSAYGQAGVLTEDDMAAHDVVMVSAQPEAKVCTVMRIGHDGVLWEVMTTGSRDRAMEEVQGRQDLSVVEETVQVNRVTSKGRKS